MSEQGRRRDAAENHERLLEAAERLFGSRLGEASPHALAREAGVGIGTVYRHFPDATSLLRELYDRVIARMDPLVGEVASAPDGWSGIETYLDGLLRIMAAYPSDGVVLELMRLADPDYRPAERFRAPMIEMVRRAQAEGSLRADVTTADLVFTPYLLAALLRFPEPQRTLILARQRRVVLDGLRATSATPMPERAPTSVEVDAAAHHQKPC